MQNLGLSWLVLKLTSSGTALGLVTALQFGPILIFAPIGGVIVDRFNKRKLLYITQSIAGLLALILGLLVMFNKVELWMIYTFAFCMGMVAALDNPARTTFIHEMVGRDQVKNAVTLNSILFNLARFVGPALAGIIIAAFGLASCFLVNAISFIAVLSCLLLMDGKQIISAERISGMKGQFVAGLKYAKNVPAIRDNLIMMAIVGTMAYEFQVSLPLMAKFIFNGNINSLALLLSAMGAGAVLGGLYVAGKKGLGLRRVALAAASFGVALLAVSFSPNLLLAIMAMFLVGFFSIAYTSQGNATLQLNSSPEMRGRVMSFWTAALTGTTLIGGPIVGWIAERTNARFGLAAGAISALIAAGYGLLMAKKSSVAEETLAD